MPSIRNFSEKLELSRTENAYRYQTQFCLFSIHAAIQGNNGYKNNHRFLAEDASGGCIRMDSTVRHLASINLPRQWKRGMLDSLG